LLVSESAFFSPELTVMGMIDLTHCSSLPCPQSFYRTLIDKDMNHRR
jgi:hypothetical protein